MAGPGTPSTEGPSFTPPPLPFGWIAQWDSSSKRYYYVQLSTGQSQWEVPTHAIPTGMTPHPVAEHPYGYPQPEIITFEDGSQSKRHADGTIEPVLPDGNSRPGDVATTEPVLSATGDRGIGSIAVNALLGQAKNSHANSSHSNSNSGGLGSLGSLAGQVIGGLSGGKTNSSNNHGNTSKLSGGKLAAQLAQGLFSSSGKTGGNSTNSHNPHNNHGSSSNGASPSSSNYHGGTTSGAPQSHGLGGLGGNILGGLVGGNKPSSTSNFGYSNTSPNAAYNGEAPANSYQTAQNSTHGTHPPQSGPPPATHYHQQPSHSSNSYHSPPAAANNSYQAPPPATAAYHNTHNHNTTGNPSYQGSASGSNYGSPPAVPSYNRPDSGPHSHHNSSPNHATYPGATAVGTSGAAGFGGGGGQSTYHHQSQPVSHHGGGAPPQPSSSGPSPYSNAGGYTHTQPHGQPHGQPAYGNHAPPPTQGYQHHNQYAPPPTTNYGAASGYGNPHY